MISRSHRFHGRGSLRFVYAKGQSVRGAQTVLKYIKNERREHYRLAVIVSRKVSKSAVVRNRIRRRLYEVVRLEAAKFTGVYDMTITVHSSQLADMDAVALKQVMTELLSKAGIIPSNNQETTRDIVNTSNKTPAEG